jgi:hypothetical protein
VAAGVVVSVAVHHSILRILCFMLLLRATIHLSGKDNVGSLFTGFVIVILVVVVVSVMLKLASLSRRFCFSDCRDSFASFLVLFVCFSGFWFPSLFSDLLRFARIQSFHFGICDARKFGKADDSGYG